MITDIISILTIIFFLAISIVYAKYKYDLNIYNQKLKEMHDMFEILGVEKIKNFKFSSYREFNIVRDGEKGVEINEKYFVNKQYQKLVKDFQEKRARLPSKYFGIMKIYGSLILFISIIYLLDRFGLLTQVL